MLQLLQNDKIMFNAADKNKDGLLTKAEFVPFSHPEEHPDMLPLILNNTLEEKDLNKDGEIDFQEFIGDKGKCFTRLDSWEDITVVEDAGGERI